MCTCVRACVQECKFPAHPTGMAEGGGRWAGGVRWGAMGGREHGTAALGLPPPPPPRAPAMRHCHARTAAQHLHTLHAHGRMPCHAVPRAGPPLRQFDVNWDALGEALDRFAQFFICPTISEDGIEREVRGVASSQQWLHNQRHAMVNGHSHQKTCGAGAATGWYPLARREPSLPPAPCVRGLLRSSHSSLCCSLGPHPSSRHQPRTHPPTHPAARSRRDGAVRKFFFGGGGAEW